MNEEKEMKAYIETARKLFEVYARLREVCEEELMNFSTEELVLLRDFYREELTYPLYQDVVDLLSGPEISDTVH